MMRTKRFIAIFLCLMLVSNGLLCLTGCSVKTESDDLMKGITSEQVFGKTADDAFITGTADFAIRLFQSARNVDKNSLISPLSVLLALSMTANGAEGETLAQMEALLGGGIPIEDLNEYLLAYANTLPTDEKTKLTIANSIWFRDSSFTVEENFLQKNADYYDTSAYKAAFDEKTRQEINTWVEENTDGMIMEIIDRIDPTAVMYLVNAVLFDAEWQNIYYDFQVDDGVFTATDDTEKTVSMMHSSESFYLDDGKATGFIKPYKNGYSFVALLPNEEIALDDYVASLTGETFLGTVKNATEVSVGASIPKFSYEYGIEMSGALKSLGMTLPFDVEHADFSRLGHSSEGNIYISRVLHNAYIAVDEKGTKAGAATVVEPAAGDTGADTYRVILNRPFVYAIIDDATGLPIFIGAVTDIQE